MIPKVLRTALGHFSSDGREYVIETPHTPRPWINVISNGDYGFTVSQAGSGYSWRTHAQLNRITRWEQDLIKDEWGKYIYIREGSGQVWSAGWKPVCAEPEHYRCTHGIGYTLIESKNRGIESALLMFAPNDDPLEIWHLTLRNTTRRERWLSLFTYFEWGLGASPDWHREFHKSFIETEYDPAVRAIYARKRLWEVPTDRGQWNTDWPYVAFHGSSLRPASYDGDKESFLGMYGSLGMPAAVAAGKLSRRTGNWLDPIASLQVNLTLKAREEKSVWFTLGAAGTQDEARLLIGKYRDEIEVRRSLAAVKERWDRMLETVEVKTPDPSMDVMENVWLKYQAISCRLWARTAYYQTGGAYGFRDQLQDSQVFCPIDPSKTREQIHLHARHQFKDGSVYHWWHPLSEIGLRSQISDNLLWLPYVVKAFIDETGSMEFLDEREPFVDDQEGGTLYDHCTRAIGKALDRFSPRGLPLIGAGDWNDGLSAVGLQMKGESVWLGQFLHRVLLDFTEIADRTGDSQRAGEYRERAGRLKQALNDLGWDGNWYYGATKDSGERLGSQENAEGSVWLNPQTWAIIGGVADHDRGCQVFSVVQEKLETEIGPLLLFPSYKIPDRYIGYLTRYSPGMRENGGVYTHAATWAIIAAAMLGRGNEAYEIYSRLNPARRGQKPEKYCVEPYVTSGNIEGPESPFFGRGGWTWYSGSAAWLFKAGLEWILGVRPEFEGLVIDPCIPARWKRYRVRRLFRGATYTILVENPDGVETGIRTVEVDGNADGIVLLKRGCRIAVLPAGTEHLIRVTMGKSSQ